MNSLDVNIQKNGINKQVKMELRKEEKELLTENFERFKISMKELSRKSNDCHI